MSDSVLHANHDQQQTNEIRERYEVHEVVYERPHFGAACWMQYRTTGRCECNAESDMAALLDQNDQLRAALAALGVDHHQGSGL